MARVLEARAIITATAQGFAAVEAKLASLGRAARGVDGVSGRIAAAAKVTENVGKKAVAVGRTMTAAVTIPTAIAAKRGYDTMLGFSKELNEAQSRGELTAEQRKIIEADAMKLGRDTQFTAKQALQMIRTYIQAGRSLEQARGMTKPTLDFGLFGDVDPKKAADTITAVASAYRLPMATLEDAAKSATHVADVIAKAANISRADVGDLAQGFKYAAPLAKLSGMSMEELAGAIATMSNNGLRGDEAGVALRSMLVRMVAPTKKANAVMAELGLTWEQFAEMRPISVDAMIGSLEQQGVVAKRFRTEIEKIVSDPEMLKNRGEMIPKLVDALIKGSDQDTPENREKITESVGAYLLANASRMDLPGFVRALIEKQVSAGQLPRLFDQRQGGRAATLLSPEFFKNAEILQREAPGASARGARLMEQGLYGAHQKFLSSLEYFVLSLGNSGVSDAAANALRSTADAINNLAEVNPKVLELTTYAVGAAAALGPLAYILGNLAKAGGTVLKLLSYALPAGTTTALAAAAGTPAGAAFLSGLPLMLAYEDARRGSSREAIEKYRSDMMRAGFLPADRNFLPDKVQPSTLDGVRSALDHFQPATRLDGRVDVSVKVEPSDGFWAKVKSIVSGNLFGGGAKESGSSGSTGPSMPEAGPYSP